MSVLNHNILIGASGARDYEIANSLRFNDNDSAYLSRTPASAGNQQTFTYSAWLKLGNLGTHRSMLEVYVGASDFFVFQVGSDDRVMVYYINGGTDWGKVTSMRLRDPSSWYHIQYVNDSTNATAGDRMRIYINGERITDWATDYGDLSLNNNSYINGTSQHKIGYRQDTGTYHDGYLADVHFIDGQALDPSNFGETGDYGEWKPIQYTGTYGTNGFYLDFEASGDLGNDVSGNGNDWTPTNLAATDQMLDTPTNNFASVNVLHNTAGYMTYSEGNLKMSIGAQDKVGHGTFAIPASGKWYFEYVVNTVGAATIIGLSDATLSQSSGTGFTGGNFKWSGGFANTDVVGVAVNEDTNTCYIYKNNVLHATHTGLGDTEWYPAFYLNNANGVANFGQDSSFAGNKTAQGNTDANGKGDFYYSPPSGYLALCTDNLFDPSVIPSEHFNTVLYTGNGSSSHAITGVGFGPELVWLKPRTSAYNHRLYDLIRGATKTLSSNTTAAEATNANSLLSLDSDGFTVGSDISENENTTTYVAWNWKANGAGVSNTDGSITSTVSANTDAGFSIVGYTGNATAGATVGHGLSQAPDVVIVKHRDSATSGLNWLVDHSSLTADYLLLNGTGGQYTQNDIWNSTAPSATVFTLGTNAAVNESGTNFISYCFHSVDGFSKFGSYSGNGSADGPFVYCGFRPAYVMIKRTDSAASWVMLDSDRDIDNAVRQYLYADASSAEAGSFDILDFTSNGFKIRDGWSQTNTNGGTYIFMAFAEMPFANTNAR